jgi:hypothetical protein
MKIKIQEILDASKHDCYSDKKDIELFIVSTPNHAKWFLMALDENV